MFHRGDNVVERNRKANETKARRKTFREEFEIELAAAIKDKNGNMTTTKNAISKTAVQKALRGDLRAMEFIRDTIGEKPSETITLLQPDFTELDSLEL